MFCVRHYLSYVHNMSCCHSHYGNLIGNSIQLHIVIVKLKNYIKCFQVLTADYNYDEIVIIQLNAADLL